jgi:hypothetical protein
MLAHAALFCERLQGVGGIDLDLGKDGGIIRRIFARGLSIASFSRKAKTALALAGACLSK